MINNNANRAAEVQYVRCDNTEQYNTAFQSCLVRGEKGCNPEAVERQRTSCVVEPVPRPCPLHCFLELRSLPLVLVLAETAASEGIRLH